MAYIEDIRSNQSKLRSFGIMSESRVNSTQFKDSIVAPMSRRDWAIVTP
jgi:hypothetical protein